MFVLRADTVFQILNSLRTSYSVGLATVLVFVCALIWLNYDHFIGLPIARGESTATIEIELQQQDLTELEENSLISGPSLRYIALTMRAKAVSQRTLASFNHDELNRVLGAEFLFTGKTSFAGVRIKQVSADRDYLRITSTHVDPDIARLVVSRFLRQYRNHITDVTRTEAKNAISELYFRKAQMVRNAEAAEAEFASMNPHTATPAFENKARDIKILRALLQNMDNRIAETEGWLKKPIPSQFRITRAQVVTGPLWNRSTIDFTADAESLTIGAD